MARMLLLMMMCVVLVRTEDLAEETCTDTKRSTAVYPSNAKAIIGGLFGMRVAGTDGYGCGLPAVDAMQIYEAARWAISKINNGNRRIAGIELGMKAYDTCYSTVQVGHAAHEFFPQSTGSNSVCDPVDPQQISLGFLGPESSWTSKVVASLIKSFPMAAVSPRAASSLLSNKVMYPTFLRTSPTTSMFARVTTDLLEKLQWQKIVLVYSDNEYGKSFFTELTQLTFNQNKCVVLALPLKESQSLEYYKTQLSTLSKSDVKGGIVFGAFGSLDVVIEAMDSVISTDQTIGEIQWLFSDLSLNKNYNNKIVKGSILIRPSTAIITEFRDYFVGLENNIDNQAAQNPWYKEWYMLVNQCKFDGVIDTPYVNYGPRCEFLQKGDSTNFVQRPFVDTTIKAVYAFAEALRKANEDKCTQTGTFSFCADLIKMGTLEFYNSYLKKVKYTFTSSDGISALTGQTVQFDGNGDPVESKLQIWQYKNNKYEEVGNFENNVLTLNTNALVFYDWGRNNPLNTPPVSLCPNNICNNCILPYNPATIMQVPGDILLTSLIQLHIEGQEPFTCGISNIYSLQNLVAIKYALSKYSSVLPTDTLKNIKLGGLFIDMCSNREIATSFLVNLLSGDWVYRDSMNRFVDPHKIKMFVGSSSSRFLEQTSMITSAYRLPEIDSEATSSKLAQRKMYPYFNRAIPSDKVQVVAIANFLKKMDWKYFQIVVRDDAFGRQALMDMQEHAKQAKICIAAVHKFTVGGRELVNQLRQVEVSGAVVVFGYKSNIRLLLQGMKDEDALGEFVLIGADPWGTRQSVIQGYEEQARGSVIVTMESTENLGFTRYLDDMYNTVEKIQQDPIFSQWYEAEFQCYLNAGSKQQYKKVCDPPGFSVSSKLWISQYTPALISSVYASASALHQTLVDVCGSDYKSVCSKARGSMQFSEKLLEKIRNIQLNYNDGGSQQSFQIKDGEGTQNFNFYTIQNGVYSKIATYNTKSMSINSDFDSNNLVLPPRYRKPSVCYGVCYECFIYQMPPRMFIPGDFIIGALFAISTPGNLGPFACGSSTTTDGFQYSAAVQYALSKVNAGTAPVKLSGVSVGGYIEDHCSNPHRPDGILSAFYSGLIKKMMAWNGADTSLLKPSRVAAWLTDHDQSSAEAGKFLKQFNIPVVSPSATSTALKSNPAFYRTIQGEDTIAMAMVKMAKALNFLYIHVISGENEYGESGVRNLKAAAQQEGICVTQSHTVTSSNTVDGIVQAVSSSASHVVVLYLLKADMSMFINAIKNKNINNLILISPNTFPSVMKDAGDFGKNMLALQLKSPPAATAGYLAYINDMKPQDNEFFTDYYMSVFKCDLPGYYSHSYKCGTNLNDFSADKVSNVVLPTMNAVYAVVDALDKTLRQYCGETYDGLCAKFQNADDVQTVLIQNLNQVSFVDPTSNTFQFRDREGNADYDILRYDGNQYNTVGSYAGATIQITGDIGNHYSAVLSGCSVSCIECLQHGLNFSYVPGDILLGGLFDVHQKSLNPFTCGAINTLHGFQLLEAFNYALSQVNNKDGMFKNILKGTRLGGVGLDACESAIRTGYLVSNVHNKLTTLVRNADTIDPEDIDVYIGAYGSDQSIYLARILKDLEIPQISYGSTSTQLKDQFKYPYFYRTVPADDHQVRAMVSFLNKHDLRYVQVVYTVTNYGEFAAEAFKRLAPEYRICVAQMVLFPDNGTVSIESSNDVITGLMQKPLANTIVVFAGTNYINAFLKAIDRNKNAKEKFRFLGSETWANNEDAIIGVEKIALGSVTLNLETKNIDAFDLYLEGKTPANSQQNPWFNEYYENIHNCYLTKSDGLYSKQCQSEPKILVRSIRYKQDPGILHVINSVYAAAFAIDKAIKEVCGDNYLTVCEQYKKKSDRRSLVLKHMQNVSFTDPSKEQFRFSNLMNPTEDHFTYSREGNKGYQFYSLVFRPIENRPGYVYKEIGTFSSSGKINVPTYVPNWDSSCNREDTCTECPQIRNNRGPRYSVFGPRVRTDENPITIVGVFDIHEQGTDPYRCGELKQREGFQQFLAFLYTFSLPPFRNLRAVAIDTCSNSLRVDQDLWNLLAGRGLCSETFSKQNEVKVSNVGGIIVMNDLNTIAASRVLDPLKVTYISPSAQSLMFNDSKAYPYLARTISPREQVLKVLAELFKLAKWDYVVGIESYWKFDTSGYDEFVKLSDGKTCLRSTYNLPENPRSDDYEQAIQSAIAAEGSHVVMLFTTKKDSIQIFEAAKKMNVLDKFLFVLTDVTDITGGFEYPPGVGYKVLYVAVRRVEVENFKKYVANLDYDTDSILPDQNITAEWFEEYFQKLHKCRLEDAKIPLMEFTTKCDKSARILPTDVYENRYILPTIAAVYALGNELSSYKTTECDGTSVQDCLKAPNARDKILNNVLGTRWPNMKAEIGIQNNEDITFQFNAHRVWDFGFDVWTTEAKKSLLTISDMLGTWKGDEFKSMGSFNTLIKTFTSTCPENTICGCTQPDAGSQQAQILPSTTVLPRNFFLYSSKTGEQLYDWPVWAIAVAVLTSIGIIVTLLILIFLLIFYPIRGGTTILGFLTILGILGIYGVNFAFFLPASEITCAARRLVMGIVYMIVFACLLVKAVDNWRYRDCEWEEKRYRGITSACALFLCALGLICIQAIIPIEWLILQPPTAQKASGDLHDLWFCHAIDNTYDTGLVQSFIFVIVIVALTAIVSMMSWDSDNNYYESRWILVSCICTAGCFLVWMIVSTNAGHMYRDPTVTIANFVNATLLLICIPLRKAALFIMVRNEEKKEKLAVETGGHDNDVYTDVYANQAYEPNYYEYQRQESKQESDIGF